MSKWINIEYIRDDNNNLVDINDNSFDLNKYIINNLWNEVVN